MASRTSSRSGRSSRSSSAAKSSNTPVLAIGGAGVVVVGLLVILLSNGGNQKPAAEVPSGKPAVAGSPTPASSPAARETARSGKTPGKPAPALTEAMLQQARGLLAEAKALCNEGVAARTAGDNQGARSKQSLAKDQRDQIKGLLAAPALWQEEAQLGDWAQPAEYVALEKLYNEVSKLEKQVRMSGGT
jgi:hypothetical protein